MPPPLIIMNYSCCEVKVTNSICKTRGNHRQYTDTDASPYNILQYEHMYAGFLLGGGFKVKTVIIRP